MRVDFADCKRQRKAVSNIIYDASAPKKLACLGINADLLQQARQLNISLSQTPEQHLAEIVRQEQRSQWLEENRSALDEYNRRIESRGPFSDSLRRF